MIKLKKLVEAINDAAEIANASLANSEDQVINNYFDKDEKTGKFIAKTITIEYPEVSPDGKIKKLNIEVPLITIVPISSARIEEMKFTTDLDIAIDNDELMVSFSNKTTSSGLFNKSSKHPSATVELVVKPQENSEGLSKLIEGYEKLLRSKIPG